MKKNSQDLNFTKNSPQISEVLSSLIFESNLYMAWLSGKDALLTQFNERWLSFTGRTIQDEEENGWTYVVHPNDLLKCLYKYKNAFHSRKEFKIRYRLKKYDGNYYWVLNHGWPIVDGNQYFLGYIGLCDLLSKEKSLDKGHSEILQEKKNESINNDLNNMLIEELNELNLKKIDAEAGFNENPLLRTSDSNITKRELEIIDLLIQGYRNKQIAKMLKISSNTVRNHIFNIFSKYNVSNRVQLINQINQPKS